MALTSHDVLASVHVPDLPRAVVGRCGHNLLPLVERHASNTSGVSLDLSGSCQSGRNRLISLSQEWIRAGVLRHASILCDSFAKGALAEKLRLISGG